MARIVLVRPGSTDYDDQGRIRGTLDVPLNQEGNAEVLRLIDGLRHLGVETVYASPCQPAQETARAIAKALDVKVKTLDRMQNLNHGLWQGMRIDEVRRKQPKVYRQWQETPECICPPGGETVAEAEGRVRAAVTRILKRHKEGVIALVVPEPLASLVRRFIDRGDLGDLWKASTEHGQWEVFEVHLEVFADIG
jgi:broad specificity phosphatase PhoE